MEIHDGNSKNNQKSVFDERLRDFERKVKNTSVQKSADLEGQEDNPWMFVFRGGIELVSGFVVGILIGYGLDYWFSSRPVFIIMFSVLGTLAGILNVWHLVKPDDIRLR